MAVPLGAFALLLLLPAGALGTTPDAYLTAPFHHVHLRVGQVSISVGCAKGQPLARAFFNASSGHGGFGDRARAWSCAGVTSSRVVEEGRIGLTIALHEHVAGHRFVQITWVSIGHGALNLTPGNCTLLNPNGSGKCDRSAAIVLNGSAYVLDETTGGTQAIGPSVAWSFTLEAWANTTCVHGSCTTSQSSTLTQPAQRLPDYPKWILGPRILAGQHYAVVLAVYGGVALDLTSTGSAVLQGAAAAAHFFAAGPAGQETLYSVSTA